MYSLESGKEALVTDGIGDARYPVFDKGGKSLFFAVSTDVGLSSGWLDLSSFQHPVLRSIYAAVLKKGDPSPVEPQSDEEKTRPAELVAGTVSQFTSLSATYCGRKGAIALVGNDVLRVGELLVDNRRVIEIAGGTIRISASEATVSP